MFWKVTLPSTLIFSVKDVCTINLTVSFYLYLYLKPRESFIYFFAPFSIFYIPHIYVIPQAMPHAIPQTHFAFYPHRCRSYGEFPTASETDETLTRLAQSTHVYMCHAISFMSYDVRDLERFPISQEVTMFFF